MRQNFAKVIDALAACWPEGMRVDSLPEPSVYVPHVQPAPPLSENVQWMRLREASRPQHPLETALGSRIDPWGGIFCASEDAETTLLPQLDAAGFVDCRVTDGTDVAKRLRSAMRMDAEGVVTRAAELDNTSVEAILFAAQTIPAPNPPRHGTLGVP